MSRSQKNAAWVLSFSLMLGFSVAVAGCSSGGADPKEPDEMLRCDAPLLVCGDACIDPRSNSAHCGASGDCSGSSAGISCARDNVCVAGVCTPSFSCGASRLKCGGQCTDPQTDTTYCGATGDCAGSNAGRTCQPIAGRCGAMTGPQCVAGQCVSSCKSGSKTFAMTGLVENFSLPSCVTEITVKVSGAQGGSTTEGCMGGRGAEVKGRLCVTPGSVLTIVVGEQPPTAHTTGGGGGSYVALGSGTSAMPLFVAGGGGGGWGSSSPAGAAMTLATSGSGIGGQASRDGGGGGGFTDNGVGTAGSGGLSFKNGSTAGKEFPVGDTNLSRGGFGGGGGASESGTFNAGGGGGFDGGNSGNGSASTGGSSYISTNAVETMFSPNVRSGHGSVEISW